MIKLKRPLVFFDLETTGLNTDKDKILQIAVIKIMPGNEDPVVKDYYFNPGVKIPKEASDIHGITDDIVIDKPLFSRYAKGISEFFKDCDIASYNGNTFDIPMLASELRRCGINNFPQEGTILIDVLKIERLFTKCTLSDTYERYMNEEFSDAHNAMCDTEATLDIFMKQLSTHNLPNDIGEIEKLSMDGKDLVDWAGKFYKKDNEYYYGFGPGKDTLVSLNLGLLDWMEGKDFTEDTIQWARKIKDEIKK